MAENGSQRASRFVPSSIHPLFRSQMSPSADLAVALFLTFTGVISLLGNGTVLLVSGRRRKKLRPPELLTINLALCDFGFSLLGAPFFIVSSVSHAWVFGDTGCLWYGVQGFVFGVGSLLSTCLVSLDRCLKICCFRYGQWIEKRYVYLSIVLVWVYTLFWASLPAFGFGSYGPEPYGTSCTINWWRMRSSLRDRTYVILILTLCFGLPTVTIVTSYLAILLMVHRSKRTLASISSSSGRHTNKDLRLTKMTKSQNGSPKTVPEESAGVAPSSPNAPEILHAPSLLNWTVIELYKQICDNPGNKWSEVINVTSASTLDKQPERMTRSPEPTSSLPPVVTLIPAMSARSHCMINPFIYQVMSRQFRHDVYVMVFGKEKAEGIFVFVPRKPQRATFESLFHLLSLRKDQPELGEEREQRYVQQKEHQ